MAHIRHRALPLLNHAAAPRISLTACMRNAGGARTFASTAAAAGGGKRSPKDSLSHLRRRRLRDGAPGEAAIPSRILVQDDVGVVRGRLSQGGEVQGRLGLRLRRPLHAGDTERGWENRAAAAAAAASASTAAAAPAGVTPEAATAIGEAVMAVKEAAMAISRASGAMLHLTRALERAGRREEHDAGRERNLQSMRETAGMAKLLERTAGRPVPQVAVDLAVESEAAAESEEMEAMPEETEDTWEETETMPNESQAATQEMTPKAIRRAAAAAKRAAKKARKEARRAEAMEAQMSKVREQKAQEAGTSQAEDGDGDGEGPGEEAAPRPLTKRDRARLRNEDAAARREAGRVAAKLNKEKRQAWAGLRAASKISRKAAKEQKLADAAQAELGLSDYSEGSDSDNKP
ncbi:hypothetical protein GGTG_04424 [Gaeumannomyces tritici R3-111a-1]|uniref:Uncharacterized protein n=1 Tax=Gaeumannomyces tritici (strain R3-111a-1) TaxID=644352 RepID=J3NT26_GAET3|nr:hypothetical protein GGTG_04424 [Gaeumannomyces tritici R3-111a-1]EJT79339.1 hypothetical protein GGTG_04424 [Gaeumannomyces tritici R3-111a-1]